MNMPLSSRDRMIRDAVLDVLGSMTEPAITSEVSRLATAKLEAGPVGLVMERQEIRKALVGLEAHGLIERHATGEVERAYSRFGSRMHTRAAKGSVSWSLRGPAVNAASGA